MPEPPPHSRWTTLDWLPVGLRAGVGRNRLRGHRRDHGGHDAPAERVGQVAGRSSRSTCAKVFPPCEAAKLPSDCSDRHVAAADTCAVISRVRRREDAVWRRRSCGCGPVP